MEQCQACGMFFKRLSSHTRHCKGPHDHNKASISTDKNTKEESKADEMCPKCQRSFKRLASHLPHCKGTSSADLSLMHTEFQPKGASREETCPKCYKSFKKIASHSSHCKGVPKEEDFSKRDGGLQRQSSNLPYRKSNPDVETYPRSYHIFRQLSLDLPHCEGKHRDQKYSKSKSMFENQNSHLSHYQGTHEEEIYSRRQEKIEDDGTCPMCSQYFKHLASHLPYCKIKSDKEICPKCDQSFKRLTSHLSYCKGKEVEETCPHCTKTFKNLASHIPHCEGKLQKGYGLKSRPNSKGPVSQLKEMPVNICESEIDVINDLREVFLQELNECGTPFQWSIFSTGSYYDRTKTTNIAGDYDFILYPDVKCKADFCTQAATLGYCKVTVSKDEPKLAEMRKLDLIKEHNYFSPGKMKEYAFEKFERIIKDPEFRQGRRIHRLYRSSSSPAFTILYDAGAGIQIEVDLVPGIHFEGWPKCESIRKWKPLWNTKQDMNELKKEYFCVAREHPHVDEVPDGHILWRESFSHTEKLLWKHADGARDPPTCRKPVLKALKLLLSECRSENTDINHLSTFHLRTFMLHEFDRLPSDKDWDKCILGESLKYTQKKLKIVLKDKVLMNYFVPGHNVLQEVPETETAAFIVYLNKALSTKTMQQK
ncbi:hypothetical protein CHS0354_034423 [Potamilus streckersoni]|uniref:C2H2-type domain-containing protein n=1 Tax=Potamilus streckersoni TaxID=2493646 RepID=A0AAE0S8M0_9BIVA|nr:hypothetical protein CHS0354_034423 [Potamilus streckersoni]